MKTLCRKITIYQSLIAAIMALYISLPASAQSDLENALDLSLTDLLSMEITSVSKKSQPLSEVAAAIYVITQEDLQRMGVTSIAEALRIVPGIQVARIDSNKWAISSRGFNEQFANKLLVLIDGRSVYTPSFSGVYWEVQDTMLADIDRIEVIRGPGATIWGANAMNGVINIITKKASETLGGAMESGAGNNEEAFVSLRYGFQHSDSIHSRYYFKFNQRASFWKPATGNTGSHDANDSWKSIRGGFRLDGESGPENQWTVQGDIYEVKANQLVNVLVDPFDPANAVYAPFYRIDEIHDIQDSTGWNILGRWQHQQSEDSIYTIKAFIDTTTRSEVSVEQHHHTFDFEFQHQFQLGKQHEIIWGLGYRNYEDHFVNSFQLSFYPDNARRELFSGFVQDEIELLANSLYVTIGSKFEHNDFTGVEIQPSLRMSWKINNQQTLWAAVAKAIRSPSRVDDGSRIVFAVIPPMPPAFTPIPLANYGSTDFESEELIAWEAGYRVQLTESFSSDTAIFYNSYDDLRSFESFSGGTMFGNKLEATSYGLEVSMNWQPKEWFLIQGNYSYFKLDGNRKSTSTDMSNSIALMENSAPRNQANLKARIDINQALALDMWLSYVDKLEVTNYEIPSTPVPAYTSFNIRLEWQQKDSWEFSLVGHNLFDPHHLEFIAEDFLNETEIERSVYAQLNWYF